MIDAKEYLEWIETAEGRIQRKLAEIDRLRSLATSIGGISTDTPVQASHEGDRIGKIVASIADKQKEIDDIVEEQEKRVDIIEKIENVLQYKVLYKRYVKFKKLGKIATEENYTYDWIQKNHTRGLKKVQEILNNAKESVYNP